MKTENQVSSLLCEKTKQSGTIYLLKEVDLPYDALYPLQNINRRTGQQ